MKKAFTLAEILITLSIIGVIASMTIPSLVQDVQDAQFKTAWKKIYADINQATKRVMLDNGGDLDKLCSNENSTCLKTKFSTYLNYISEKTGAYSSNALAGCWEGTFPAFHLNEQQHCITLNNGASLDFDMEYGDCSDTTRCFHLHIDVNGIKGPNIIGKDKFIVTAYTEKIDPTAGPFGTTCNDGIGNENQNYGCGKKYLYQ